jgi:hypothetical protein
VAVVLDVVVSDVVVESVLVSPGYDPGYEPGWDPFPSHAHALPAPAVARIAVVTRVASVLRLCIIDRCLLWIGTMARPNLPDVCKDGIGVA